MPKNEYKDYEQIFKNMPNTTWDKVDAHILKKAEDLATEDLINDLIVCLELDVSKKALLKEAVIRSFITYFECLKIQKEKEPFSEQHKKLKKVCNSAGKLLEALEELDELPEAKKMLFKEFSSLEYNIYRNLVVNALLIGAGEDKDDSLHGIKELITDLLISADESAYDWKKYFKKFPEESERLEAEMTDDETAYDDLQVMYATYGNAKFAPIRGALTILKMYWEEHTDYTFSAGKYYKEIGGYNSQTIEALEMICMRIDPTISQRNIVTHMQAINL